VGEGAECSEAEGGLLQPPPSDARLASRATFPHKGEGKIERGLAMKARIFVTLKNGVLDPQGKAIGHALNGLGFGQVGEVRQGKVIDIELDEKDETSARANLKQMCEKLLANTVIEKYEIELKG
jgi:phosphoribosylformylglycinamidine synthase subunit PurS